MDEQEVHLSKWRKFQYRDRLSDVFDVPEDFGLLGVYLLASPKPSSSEIDLNCFPPEVIYIGMSENVTKRLDKSHKAVIKYKDDSGDVNMENLYYSEWLSEYSNMYLNSNDRKMRVAFIHYIERKYIWEFAKKYGGIPKYNGY